MGNKGRQTDSLAGQGNALPCIPSAADKSPRHKGYLLCNATWVGRRRGDSGETGEETVTIVWAKDVGGLAWDDTTRDGEK